jgi:hypothetical protein
MLLLCTGISAIAQNRALRLSKTGDFLSIDNSASLGGLLAFTLETYIFFEPGGTEGPRIFSKGWEANNGLEFAFNGTGSARKISIASAGVSAFSKTTLQSNRWYHVAVAYDSGSGFFAIDGQLDSTFTAVLQTQNNFPVNLGRNSGTGRDQLKGYLDEFRVWNRKLTLSEIRTNMYSTLTGSEPGLVAYWNFDSGTGKDLSPFKNDGALVGATIEPVPWPLQSPCRYLRPLRFLCRLLPV